MICNETDTVMVDLKRNISVSTLDQSKGFPWIKVPHDPEHKIYNAINNVLKNQLKQIEQEILFGWYLT